MGRRVWSFWFLASVVPAVDGGPGTAALFLLTPGTGLCTGGSLIPAIHWATGGVPLTIPPNAGI